MTALLVFLKVIAYIISIPAICIITIFLYMLGLSYKLIYFNKKSKYYAIGYLKGSFGLELLEKDYIFCKNDTNYSDCVKGHRDGKCKIK